MSKKPTALEQALLESDEIIKVVTDNAKNMLYAQLKPELEQAIKESIEFDNDSDLDDEDDDLTVVDDKPEELGSEIIDTKPEDSIQIDEPIDKSIGDPELDDEFGDEDDMDLTGLDDENLIKVFKKIGDDTEIEVVKDGDTLTITKDGEEFLIKLNENEDFDDAYNKKPSLEEEKYDFVDNMHEDAGTEDEMIYEIVMDDENDSTTNSDTTVNEVARTHADGRKQERKPEGFYKYASSRLRPAERSSVNEQKIAPVKDKALIKEATELKSTNSKLITENTSLKDDLTKHKNALRLMTENLQKIALFNTNLANINKIICMNPTTLDERKSVMSRFNDVETIKESEMLYKTIISELKNVKTNLVEEIENKINGQVNTIVEQLTESTKPDSPAQRQINRVKEIMSYKSKS